MTDQERTQEVCDAFTRYMESSPGKTREELFSVYRLYDNYTLSKDEAQARFDAIVGPVPTTDQPAATPDEPSTGEPDVEEQAP